jgi:hypothetical protein
VDRNQLGFRTRLSLFLDHQYLGSLTMIGIFY